MVKGGGVLVPPSGVEVERNGGRAVFWGGNQERCLTLHGFREIRERKDQ